MPPTKRVTPRRDLKWNVCVIDADGTSLGYCSTLNVSATGAKLVLQEKFDVPDKFAIAFSADGKVRRSCKVIWRNDDEIGVRFTSA